MFDALYSFLDSKNPGEETIRFVKDLVTYASDFAFFDLLPEAIKTDLKSGSIDLRKFIHFLIYSTSKHENQPSGFGYGELPKGLIPFHRYPSTIRNPFQEHILQSIEIAGPKSTFHFTINEKFKDQIDASIGELKSTLNLPVSYSFSIQNPATDAIAFDENLNPANDENGMITRPSGHGALLGNLNTVHSDLIFIRNIDNIQHQSKATHSIQYRKALGGMLIYLRSTIFDVLHELEKGIVLLEKIQHLNDSFDLRIPIEKFSDTDFLIDFLNRPIRICGMVRNEGQPGGGPFWVNDPMGIPRRQIVEKSQITNSPEQLEFLNSSTHFNPVELVCSTKNFKGDFFNLTKFRNDDLYFIVKKNHHGKSIQYIEEPGLWNGSMNNWLTLFYEIESDCFSPVKTILDLLQPLHRP